MTSSWGGVLVKMMVDGRGGVKSPNWGVHGPIYLNMTLSYRNNARKWDITADKVNAILW